MAYQCSRANSTAYVTEKILQSKYPPNPGTFTTHYSSIYLAEGDYNNSRKKYLQNSKFVITNIGSMDTFYKGQDILIRALKICIDRGYKFQLNLVGDGLNIGFYKALVNELKLCESVNFLGRLKSGSTVYTELDKSDLFVLPSLTEGLPRALIEAMARSLPALGSNVGGIPELLEKDYLFSPGNYHELADKIINFDSPEMMEIA